MSEKLKQNWRVSEDGIYKNEYGIETIDIDFSEIETKCVSVYANIDSDEEELLANAKLIAEAPIMIKYIIKKAKAGCKEAKLIVEKALK